MWALDFRLRPGTGTAWKSHGYLIVVPKTFDELNTDVLRAKARNKERWVKMDLKLAIQMLNIVRAESKTKKNDPFVEEIILKNRIAVENNNKTLGGQADYSI